MSKSCFYWDKAMGSMYKKLRTIYHNNASFPQTFNTPSGLEKDLITAKRDIYTVLAGLTGNNSISRQLLDIFQKEHNNIYADNLTQVESILGNLKFNSKIAILLDNLKKVLAREIDLTMRKAYSVDKTKFMLGYHREIWEEYDEDVVLSSDEMELIVRNMPSRVSDELPEMFKAVMEKLPGEKRIQMVTTVKPEETYALLSPHIQQYIKQFIYSYLTPETKKEIHTEIIRYTQELVPYYPYAKKTKHIMGSGKQFTLGLEKYVDGYIQDELDNIMSIAKGTAGVDRDVFLGLSFSFLDAFYRKETTKDEICDYLLKNIKEEIEDEMKQEHNTNSYREKVKLEQPKATKDKAVLIPLSVSSATSGILVRTLSESEREAITLLVNVLDVDDKAIQADMQAYIERMVSRNKTLHMQKRCNSRGIVVKDDAWDDFFTILEDTNLTKNYERREKTISDGTSSDKLSNEPNDEIALSVTVTLADAMIDNDKEVAIPDAPLFLKTLADEGYSVEDPDELSEKFNALAPAFKISMNRLLKVAAEHPHLREKMVHGYRKLRVGSKHRLIAHHKTIVGIFTHRDGYEKFIDMIHGQ